MPEQIEALEVVEVVVVKGPVGAARGGAEDLEEEAGDAGGKMYALGEEPSWWLVGVGRSVSDQPRRHRHPCCDVVRPARIHPRTRIPVCVFWGGAC